MSAEREPAETRRSSWEVCAGAASEMRTILDELEEYSGIYEETIALRKQLDRIETACDREKESASMLTASIETGGDPKAAARSLIDQLPLPQIFQDPALADAFLSELLLALARESSGKNRRERQRQGIAEAKAQGVRFGAPRRPLPENFEDVRRAWRDGEFNLTEAAARCGMAKSTFYNAAQRAEQAMPEAENGKSRTPPARQRRPQADVRLS